MNSSFFVATVAGQSVAYYLDLKTTKVAELFRLVAEKEENKDFRLVVQGHDISDSEDKSLAEVGVRAGSTVYMVLRLRGGSPFHVRS